MHQRRIVEQISFQIDERPCRTFAACSSCLGRPPVTLRLPCHVEQDAGKCQSFSIGRRAMDLFGAERQVCRPGIIDAAAIPVLMSTIATRTPRRERHDLVRS